MSRSRTFAVQPLTQQTAAPGLAPAIDIRRVPGIAAANPSQVAELDRADEAAARQQAADERAQAAMQRRQQSELERQQKEAETLKLKQDNAVKEADFRGRGVENYTDAFGAIKPVVDETGKEKLADRTGKPQWDATGKAFRTVRQDGQTRVEPLDAGAKIAPDPADKDGKYIYKQNQHSPWDTIDPEAGLGSPDAKVQLASAAHLKAKRARELATRIKELDIEDTGSDKPTDTEVKNAQLMGADNPEAAKVLADRAAFEKRRAETLKLKKEELALSNEDEATFSKRYLDEKRKSFATPGEQAEFEARLSRTAADHVGGIQARDAALKAEADALKAASDALAREKAQGINGQNEADIAGRHAALVNKQDELRARMEAHQKDVEGFNKWRSAQVEDAQKAQAAAKVAGAPLTPPQTPEAAADAALTPADFKAAKAGLPFKEKDAGILYEGDVNKLPSVLKAPGLAGKEIYLRGKSDGIDVIETGESIKQKDDNGREFNQFNVTGKRFPGAEDAALPTSGDTGRSAIRGKATVEEARAIAKPEIEALTQEADFLTKEAELNAKTTQDKHRQLSESVAAGKMTGDELNAVLAKDAEAFQNEMAPRREAAFTKLAEMRRQAFNGVVPINTVVDLYRKAGIEIKDMPDVSTVMDAAAKDSDNDPAAQKKREKALVDYVNEYSDQPLYDEAKVAGLLAVASDDVKGAAIRALPWYKRWSLTAGNIGLGVAKIIPSTMQFVNGLTGRTDKAIDWRKDEQLLNEWTARRGSTYLGEPDKFWSGATVTKTLEGVLPSVIESMAYTAAGAVIGTAAAPGPGTAGGSLAGIGGFLTRIAARNAIKAEAAAMVKAAGGKLAMQAAERTATQKIMAGLVRETKAGVPGIMTDAVVSQARQAFGKWGMGLASMRGNAGEYLSNALDGVTMDQLEADPDILNRALAPAVLMGVPAGMLDVVGPLAGADKMLLKKFFPGMAATSAQEIRKTGMAAAAKIMKEAAGDISKEYLTGFGQGALGVIAQRMFEGKTVDAPLNDKEWNSVLDNAALEAAGGGIMTGIGSAKSAAGDYMGKVAIMRNNRDMQKAQVRSDAVVNATPEELATTISDKTGETFTAADVTAATALSSPPAAAGDVAAIDASLVSVDESFKKAFAEGNWKAAAALKRQATQLHDMRRQAAETHVFQGVTAVRELATAQQQAAVVMQQAQASGDQNALELAQAGIDAVNRAQAVARVANGADVATLPDVELRAIGYERGPDGKPKAIKGAVPAVTASPEGGWIITDAAIAEAETVSPAVRGMVKMDERTARIRSAAKAMQAAAKAAAPTVAKNATVQQTGRSWEVTVAAADGTESTVTVQAESESKARADVASRGIGMVRGAVEISSAPQGGVTSGEANATQGEPGRGSGLFPHETKPAGKIEEIARTFGGLFKGIVVKPGTGATNGVSLNLKDGTLEIFETDLNDSIAVADDPDKLMLALVAEEAIHAASLALEDSGNLNLSRLWKKLPKNVRQAFVAAYPTDNEFSARHEFIRMVVQGKVRFEVNGIVVDGELSELQMSKATLETIAEMLFAFLNDLLAFIRSLQSGLSQEMAAEVDAAAAQVVAAMEDLKRIKNEAEKAESNENAPQVTKPVSKAGISKGWELFPQSSGTLGIARDKMPQISADQRGALANFLRARGIEWERMTVDPGALRPSQSEYSPEKVEKAKNFDQQNRAILVSSDGYIVDGHHQWMAAKEKGEQIEIIRLGARIDRVLATVAEFPSAETSKGKKPDPVPGTAPAAKPAIAGTVEGDATTITANGTTVNARWVVQEASEARPSHDSQGNATPGYDQTLQPRDRSLPEYRKQAANIARNLDFAQAAYFPGTTTPATTAEYGAPVMTVSGDTIIGNGREIGTVLAYTTDAESAAKYRQDLIDNAAGFGMDPESVAAMKQPILKRLITDKLDTAALRAFSQESNEGAAMSTNAVELAGQDASRITPEILELLDPEYDVDAKQNRAFLTAYAQQVIKGGGSNEVNLTPSELARRARMGIFAAAYGLDAEGRAALDRMSGDSDDGAKKITRALQTVAPLIARMRRDIEAGMLHDRDISREMGAAVQRIAVELRDQKKAADAWAALSGDQMEMSLGDVSDLEKSIRLFLVENRGDRGRIEEAISDYVESVYNLGDPRQGDMFGASPADRQTLTSDALRVKGEVVPTKAVWNDTVRNLPMEEPVAAPVVDTVTAAAEPLKKRVRNTKKATEKAPDKAKKAAKAQVQQAIEAADIPADDKAVLKAEAEAIAPEGTEGEQKLRKALEGLFSQRLAPRSNADQDAEYMAAVESGDMETAQRMVDEAFYSTLETPIEPTPVSHEDYWRKDRENQPGKYVAFVFDDTSPPGFWVVGDTRSDAVGELEDTVIVSGRAAKQSFTYFRSGTIPRSYISHNYAEGNGEGGVSVYPRPRADSFAGMSGRDWYYGEGRQVGTGSDGEPIIIPKGQWKKLPDLNPILRDNSGNVIPLSKRFNPESNSILNSQPLASLYRKGVPVDRQTALLEAARALIEEGVRTPEALAEKLTALSVNARQYSEAVWRMFGSVDPELPATVAWNAIYEKMDAPEPDAPLTLENQTDAEIEAERQRQAEADKAKAQKDAMAARLNAPLTGRDTTGQGALFADDPANDLFSGPAAEDMAPAAEIPSIVQMVRNTFNLAIEQRIGFIAEYGEKSYKDSGGPEAAKFTLERVTKDVAWQFYGPDNVERRQRFLEELVGVRPRKAIAGVEALKDALFLWIEGRSDLKSEILNGGQEKIEQAVKAVRDKSAAEQSDNGESRPARAGGEMFGDQWYAEGQPIPQIDYTDELRKDLGVSQELLDAYDPAASVSKLGRSWQYKTITGSNSAGSFPTRKEAIQRAIAHKEIKQAQFDEPQGYRDIASVRARKWLEKQKEYRNKGYSESEASDMATAEVPAPVGESVRRKPKAADDSGQRRAKPGGEMGPNGEWYPGGAFIATTEEPKGEVSPSGKKESSEAPEVSNEVTEPEEAPEASYEVEDTTELDEAETLTLEEAEKALNKRGITLTQKSTKGGTPVWHITGKTFDVKDALKGLGAKWYAPAKAWTLFTDENPTIKLASTLAGIAAPASQSGTIEDAAGSGDGTDEDLRLRQLREQLDGSPDGRRDRGDAISAVDAGTAALIRRGLNFGMPASVVEDQIEDIAMISAAFESGKPAFLLGNGAGTGKTFVLGGAIREMRARGAKDFIYVTMNQDLIEQIKKDLADFGINDVRFHTYSEMSTKDIEVPFGAVLIFDESHNIKNADAARGGKAQPMMGVAKFTIFASATPFENPVQAEYLGGTGIFNSAGGHVEWGKAYGATVIRRKFYNSRTGRQEVEESLRWNAGKLEDGIAARQWFVKQGIMVTRPMQLPMEMVDSSFSKRPVTEEWVTLYNRVEQAYEDAMSNYRNEDGTIVDAQKNALVSMHMTNTIKRILEAAKVDHAVEDAQKILAGRDEKGNPHNAVIFVETKADRWIGRYKASEAYSKRSKDSEHYTYPEMVRMMAEWTQEAAIAKAMRERPGPRPFAEAIMHIAEAMHSADIDVELPSVEQEIVQRLGGPEKVAIYTGSVSNMKARADKEAFLRGEKRVIVATMAKGGTGLSLHDKVGNRKTFQLNINLPWVATGVDQVSGRVARYGLQSKASINWLFADNIPFERVLARRVGRRMRDMGALVKGIDTKAANVLVDNFDFEGSTDIKQVDGEVQPVAEDIFEQAARLEKNRGKASDTSNGFFETPFPLAALMTEISGARGVLLEPSAGRGNLVRFARGRKGVTSIVVGELRNDNYAALLNMFGSQDDTSAKPSHHLFQGDFMELARVAAPDGFKIPGGYNTIHMNPPFERKAGVGYQDAAHVTEAFDLLAPDGRLVAIMGEGSFFRDGAQDKAFRQFLSDHGAIVIKLPENAFKNSGTGVRTRMVVLDAGAPAGRTDMDLSDMDPDSLRDIAESVPARADASLKSQPLTERARRDAEYMAAVEVGDMETAQRMVDAAANEGLSLSKVRKNGNLILLQHETPVAFTVFKPGGDDPSRSGPAIWLGISGSSLKAGHILGNRKNPNLKNMRLFADIKNPLILDDKGMVDWAREVFLDGKSDRAKKEFPLLLSEDVVSRIKAEGYDGIIFDTKEDRAEMQRQIDEHIKQATRLGNSTSTEMKPFDKAEIIVFNPNQIKSADPVTRDDSGNVIPLSQRFDSTSDSILRSQPLTARHKAALKARNALLKKPELTTTQRASLRTAESVILAEEKAAGQSFMFPEAMGLPVQYEQLTLLSQSFRQMLRNAGVDLGALDAATDAARSEKPGERTVGNPALSLSTLDPVIMGFDSVREIEAQTIEGWDEQARAMLRADYDGTVQKLMEYGRIGAGTLDPVMTRAAQMIVERESHKKMTPAQTARMQWLVWSYRLSGTEQARALGSRRDPFKTPVERHREFLMKAIYTPSPAGRKAIENADGFAEKQRLFNEQAAEIEKVKRELARMGVSLDDLFSGEVALMLKNDPIIQNLTAKLDPRRKQAVSMIQDGLSFAEVAKATGLTQDAVKTVKNEVRAKFIDETMKKLRTMRERSRDSLKSQRMTGGLVDAAALAAMNDADAEAAMLEIAEKMALQAGFIPDAKQGRMKKVKRKPLFRPPPVRGREAPATPAATAGAPVAPVDALGRPVPRTGFGVQPRLEGTTPPAYEGGTPGPGMNKRGRLDLGDLDADESIPSGPGMNQRGRLDLGDLDADETFTGDASEWGRRLFPDAPAWEGEMLIPVGADLADIADVMKAARAVQAAKATGFDMLLEFWVNNLLSGPTTHIRNVAGNLASLLWDFTFQRGTELLVNRAVGGKKDAKMGEMRHLWKGLMPGISRGWRLAMHAWEHESDFFHKDVMDQDTYFEGFGAKGEGPGIAIGGKVGRVVRVPARLLMLMDSLFKGIVGQMEAGAQAYRIATAKGLKGEEHAKEMRVQLNTPGSQAWQLAVLKAEESTFQSKLRKMNDHAGKLSGPVGLAARSLEHAARGIQDTKTGVKLLSLLLPFVRTPYNILRTGIRKSPIGAALLVEEIISGGFAKIKNGKLMTDTHPEIVKHLAEQMIAWTAASVLAGAAEGDDDDESKWLLITGTRERQAKGDLQERTFPATTIRLFGHSFNYGSVEPLATALSVFADGVKIMKGGGTAAEKVVAMQRSFRGQIDSKTFLEGLSSAMETMQREGTWENKAKRFVLNGLVPNLIRQPLRAMDGTVRDPKDADWWYDALPLGSAAPPRVNQMTGADVQKPGNGLTRLLFPFLSNPPEKITDADRMLTEWNRERPKDAYAPGAPSREFTIEGKTYTLKPAAYDQLQRRAAALAAKQMPRYNPKVDERIKELIEKAFENGRKMALMELKGRGLAAIADPK